MADLNAPKDKKQFFLPEISARAKADFSWLRAKRRVSQSPRDLRLNHADPQTSRRDHPLAGSGHALDVVACDIYFHLSKCVPGDFIAPTIIFAGVCGYSPRLSEPLLDRRRGIGETDSGHGEISARKTTGCATWQVLGMGDHCDGDQKHKGTGCFHWR